MSILKGVKDKIDVKVTAEVESDNGKIIQVPFIITSKKPDFEGRKAFGTALDDGGMKDEELVSEFLLGWHELRGADGQEIEYNEDTLSEVMAATEYRRAVVNGILRAVIGKDALAKN